MPVQPWTAGPCQIHVGVASGGGLAFLGYTLDGVRIRHEPFFNEFRADLAGRQPFDMQRAGQMGTIIADLAVWNEDVFLAAQHRGSAAVMGSMSAADMGALMLTDALAFRLCIFPSFVTLRPSQANQPVYNYPGAFLVGPEEIGPLGLQQKRTRCIFRALPLYNPLDGSWTLWNRSATGVGPAV